MKKTALILLTALALSAHAARYAETPLPAYTPGDIVSTDVALVCQKDYPLKARDVSRSKKDQVYALYHVDPEQCTEGCKIDHLVPLAIGGSNDTKNLWPHEYGARWSVYMKTRLEIRLRKEVCSGRLPIAQAQQCIASDWIKCYRTVYPESTK